MDQDQARENISKEEGTVDPHCTVCNMPMQKPEDFGTNADGSRNEDYCCHCMQGGNLM